MSRTSRGDQRLRFFKLGNDRCPICLTAFSEREAEQGEVVTLEHVPPRSFKVGGFAMCLTCADCNNSASRAEHAAVEAKREPKVRVDMPGLPSQTGYISTDRSGRIHLRMPKPRAPKEAMLEALRSRQSFSLTGAEPNPHYASVPWLKSAYLSVFSLLGMHGCRYAKGKAVERVRKQIMKPEKEIIHHFAFKSPAARREDDGIIMNREQRPCWAVKMGDCFVLLPRSWDTSFYEWTRKSKFFSPDVKIDIGGGPIWYLAKFGRCSVTSMTFRKGFNARKVLGSSLFGTQIRATQGDMMTSFVVADYSGQDATLLNSARLSRD